MPQNKNQLKKIIKNLYISQNHQTTSTMLKQSIKQLFENYEQNKITDIPMLTFRPNRKPFDYLPPQRFVFKDLRALLKPKQTKVDIKIQSITDKIKRYANEFEFRKSYQKRIMTHTLQYTTLSLLIVFGLYSRQFSGLKRCQYVFKETLKTALYSGSIFAMNELLYPFYYKLSQEMKQKNMFTVGNLLSTFLVWPIVFLVEMNFLVSVRKSLFICAYGQIRDLQIQNQRFYRQNPDHIATKGKIQTERIKHPSEDSSKKLFGSLNSRAQQERRKQQRQELEKRLTAKNNGEKLPSTHLYMIMPEVYRPPTPEEKIEHEIKSTKKAQELLKQRGIEWLTVQVPEQPSKQLNNEAQKKKSWWPW